MMSVKEAAELWGIAESRVTLYSFLLMAGYLKTATVRIAPSGDYLCEVLLPNREIELVYRKEILQKLSPIVPQSIATSIQEAMYSYDASANNLNETCNDGKQNSSARLLLCLKRQELSLDSRC